MLPGDAHAALGVEQISSRAKCPGSWRTKPLSTVAMGRLMTSTPSAAQGPASAYRGEAPSWAYLAATPLGMGEELHRQMSKRFRQEWWNRAEIWSETVYPSVSPSWVMTLHT